MSKQKISEHNKKIISQIHIDKSMFEPAEDKKSHEQHVPDVESLNYLQDSWRRLKGNYAAMIALFILAIIVVVSFLAPLIAPYNPNEQHPGWANLPPRIPHLSNWSLFDGTLTNRAGIEYDAYSQAGVPDDVHFYLGTDALGRDLLSRILYGTRISLIIAIVAVLINMLMGVTYGLISGWYGGKIDSIMQRILEVLSGIPNLVVVVLMLLVLKPGLVSITITIALTSWISMARVVRAQTLKLKQEEYVIAAQVLGQSTPKIMFKHILPNMIGIIIVQMMFAIPSAIFFEAFLSFIGIGIPAPHASLGTLINDGYQTFRFYPHLMWYPAIVISVLMLSFNVLADGLRDAFDPKTEE